MYFEQCFQYPNRNSRRVLRSICQSLDIHGDPPHIRYAWGSLHLRALLEHMYILASFLPVKVTTRVTSGNLLVNNRYDWREYCEVYRRRYTQFLTGLLLVASEHMQLCVVCNYVQHIATHAHRYRIRCPELNRELQFWCTTLDISNDRSIE